MFHHSRRKRLRPEVRTRRSGLVTDTIKPVRHIVLLAALLVFGLVLSLTCDVVPLFAQQAPERDSVAVDTVTTVEELPTFQPSLEVETEEGADISFDASEPESDEAEITPTGAVWRSVALPGWGQYYVEDYWKAPIFLTATGFFAYRIVDNNNRFNDVKDQIAALPEDDTRLFLLRREREVYRDRRDAAGLYLLLTYLVAAIDAYVGAHLFYFDVSDDLDARLYFDPRTQGLGLSLHL